MRDFFRWLWDTGVIFPLSLVILLVVSFGFVIYLEESKWYRAQYSTPAYTVKLEYTKMTTDEVEFVMSQIQRDMLKKFK